MKLVIFDVDGTLVDSQKMIIGSMNAGFEDAGLPPVDREAVLSIVGLSLPVAIAQLIPDQSPEAQNKVVEGYRASFLRTRMHHGSPLYPGAQDCLDQLSARDDLLLAIATGKSRRGLEALVDAQGWQGLFVSLQNADLHPSKPHPAMIHAALTEAGVNADRAVMVGDTEFDIAMGVSAGTAAYGVNWGYHPADRLVAAGAALVAPDFPALTRALQEWADE